MKTDSVSTLNIERQPAKYLFKITTISELLIFALVVIGLTALLQYHWKRRRMYRMAAKIPGPTPFPIIGNAHLFAGSNLEILDAACKLLNDYKQPVKVWLGHRLFFGISKPEYLEIIFNSPSTLGKDELYKFTKPIAGEGIFSAPVPKWKKNRKIIAPTFNQKILNTFCQVFSEQSIAFVGCLKTVTGKELDILPFLENCTLDIVCETSMGVKIKTQNKESEFADWVTRLLTITFQRAFHVWYHPDIIFYNSPIGKEYKMLLKKFHNFTDMVIKSKKESYLNKKKLREEFPEAQIDESKEMKTFLELLMKLSEDGNQMTDIELRDEVNTFLIAGSDTTASTLGFSFVMIAMHPEVQNKIYEEVMDVLGPEKLMEYTDLPKFKYTDRVIKEVMRLFPIGPLVIRKHENDIDIGGHILPAGASSALLIIHTHRNPIYWPDPLKFDPNRFLPEEVAKRHPYAYVPFTGGPRICIGTKYGMMMLKTIIAHTVRSYILSTPYKNVADVKISQDLILKAVDGHKLRIDIRT